MEMICSKCPNFKTLKNVVKRQGCDYLKLEPYPSHTYHFSLVDVKNPTSRPLCQMKTYEPKFHTCHEYKFIIFTYVAQSV